MGLNKMILRSEIFETLSTRYRRRFGWAPVIVDRDGVVVWASGRGLLCERASYQAARRDAIWESERWGEAYVYYAAPEILSWALAIVNGEEVLGGIVGGEVLLEGDTADLNATVNHLAESGIARRKAETYTAALPHWGQDRIVEACRFLYEALYESGPLEPSRLECNLDNARQQSEISADVLSRKQRDDLRYPFQNERILLSLLRVGDRRGAHRILNDMLAVLFLTTPRLITLKMRVVEMLGHLVRVAAEDSPTLHSLLDLYPSWIEALLAAPTFEALCIELRHTLDELISRIELQGRNRRSQHVERILTYLSENYRRQIRMDELADVVGLSKYHMLRLVKKTTGKTVLQHIKRLRIDHSCRLLSETTRSYSDIAYDLGFADQSYFIKQFRELTGTTPARYRRDRAR